MNFCLPALAVLLLGCSVSAAMADGTVAAIRESGTLTCGVVTDIDDYSEADTHGNLSALGGDFCRALGAEILGPTGKILFFSAADEPSGLAALRDHKIDVLFGATPDPIMAQVYGVLFGPPIFYDGQGFLVSKESGIKTLADLSKRHVCFINASPAEALLYDELEPKLKEPEDRFPYSERGEMEVALVDGHCDAMTGDISWMANARASFHGKTPFFTVLPDTLNIDPLSPVYRTADAEFASLVNWTVWALLQAEAHGITRSNAKTLHDSRDPVVRRLVGATPWIGRALGVSDDAFLNAITAVGNYGEIYERNVGADSLLQLPRGRNALASNGGLMWALPVEPLQ